VLGKRLKLIRKGTKTAAVVAAAIATEAIAAARLAETKSLAAEFEAFGGGALTAEEEETSAKATTSGDHLNECWLAREQLRVSEDR
jgi:hypothetical protein